MARMPTQLRADLRRVYGVSLDDVGGPVSWRDAAAMVACLPSDSAISRAAGDGWSEPERISAEIFNVIAAIWWQRTDHSKPGNDKPPVMLSPLERRREYEQRVMYTPEYMDEVADLLGIPEDRR